jgi:hypothetical protein
MHNNTYVPLDAYTDLQMVPHLYFGGANYEPVCTRENSVGNDVQNRNEYCAR